MSTIDEAMRDSNRRGDLNHAIHQPKERLDCGDESSQLAEKISSYLTRKTGSSLDGETVDHIAKLIRKVVGANK